MSVAVLLSKRTVFILCDSCMAQDNLTCMWQCHVLPDTLNGKAKQLWRQRHVKDDHWLMDIMWMMAARLWLVPTHIHTNICRRSSFTESKYWPSCKIRKKKKSSGSKALEVTVDRVCTCKSNYIPPLSRQSLETAVWTECCLLTCCKKTCIF